MQENNRKLIRLRKLLPPPLPFSKGKGLRYYFSYFEKIDFEVTFESDFVIEDGVLDIIYDYTFTVKRLNNFNHPPIHDERIIATIKAITNQVWKDAEKINGLYLPDYLDHYTDDPHKIEVWEEDYDEDAWLLRAQRQAKN